MCIVYTSGTTGKPKGAILTHNNYLKTSELIVEAVGDTDRLTLNLSFLPLAHAFERFAGYYLVHVPGQDHRVRGEPGQDRRRISGRSGPGSRSASPGSLKRSTAG